MIRTLVLIGLLTVTTCAVPEPAARAQEMPSSTQGAAPSDTYTQSIVIPAGTRIPLSLSSPIAAKAARPGFPVRAVSGFPVTVGLHVVIPSGSYFEGMIDKVKRGGPAGRVVQMHFTQIVYPNGYTMGMDGENSIARAGEGTAILEARSVSETALRPRFVLDAAQQGPPMPPPSFPHPNIGLIAGVVSGVMAATIIAGLVVAHHNAGTTGILLDTGWQFDIVLNSPVTINLANIPASAVTPKVQM